MNTECHCCNSRNIRRCSEADKDNYDEGTVLKHCYECLDCEYSGVLNLEDWN